MKNFALRLFTVVFLLFVFQTCNEPLDRFQEGSPTFFSPPGIEIAIEKVQDIVDLQNKVGNALFRNPLVVGHGVGLDQNGNPSIIVYTQEAVKQREELTVENIGRGDYPLDLPYKIENVPLVPKVSGMFKAYENPAAEFPRPVPIGVSVGHPDITAGTIGCRVTDGLNVYLLSNNHVLANSNNAQIGDNILQPGPYDGGTEPDHIIGKLHDFEEISFSNNNLMDAAIALVTSNTLGVSTFFDNFGVNLTPNSETAAPSIGMKVQKYGRTTSHTHGTIDAINATVNVCYKSRGPVRCVQSATFVNQIVITPGEFSDGGDSGSLIVTDDNNNNPVALLYAGSTTHTIATPIDVVLDRFGVTIDDGNSVVTPPTDIFDLEVTEVTASSGIATIGDDVTINILVSNIGTIDATEDISVNLTDNGSFLKNWTITDGLSSNSSTNLEYIWSTSFSTTTTGYHTLEATLANNTDDNSLNDKNSTLVEITDGSTPAISLNASGYKVRGVRWVHLEWDDVIGDNVEITVTKDGIEFTPVSETVENNTAEIEIGKISGTFSFVVCVTTTSDCSNEAIVVF